MNGRMIAIRNGLTSKGMEYLDDVDKALIKSLKVTYITGKGNNHLVPVLMPEDTIPAFQCLANREV